MDYSNNACDMEKSYVEIYKYSKTDYTYQVYLECPSYTSKSRIKENTPSISINIDGSNKSIPVANVTINGNDKLMSYSYIIYRNNKEVKNTGNIAVTDYKEKLVLDLKLKDYSPGTIKIVVTATNTYGNTKTVTKNIPDQKVPICVRNKKGTFNVSGFSATFSDDHSGFDDYYYSGKEIFDKNGNSTEGAGCLSSKGHNPCTYRWSYIYYDDAYNMAEYTIDYKVGYIGKNDGSGC